MPCNRCHGRIPILYDLANGPTKIQDHPEGGVSMAFARSHTRQGFCKSCVPLVAAFLSWDDTDKKWVPQPQQLAFINQAIWANSLLGRGK